MSTTTSQPTRRAPTYDEHQAITQAAQSWYSAWLRGDSNLPHIPSLDELRSPARR